MLAIVALIAFGAYLLLQQGNFAMSSPSAGKLNATQIAQFAANAGFTGDDLATAVAIALAESGGDPSAYNPETAAGTPAGLGSYGLWQVYLKMHPEYTVSQLLDPQTNANAAFAIYSARGGVFTAWTTFTGGAYLSHLAVSQTAANQVEA